MENTNLEYKRVLNEHLEKIVVSFLNTDGGELKIGVTDDGDIIGVDNPDDIMNKISSRISNNIVPNPLTLVMINTENNQNKILVSVKVRKGTKPIYYIKKYGLSESGVYIRLGSACYSMQQEEINRRYLESLNYKAPLITEVESANKNLTFKDLKIMYRENGKNLNEETFKVNLNLLTKFSKYNLLADLLSDKNKVSLRVITYKGEDKQEIDEIMEFGNKSLLVCLEQVLDYFDVINRSKISFEGAVRKEQPLINKRVLREAWINAVVHNDWTDYLPPIVHVFSNRIEIVSNGGLIEKMTKEEFFRGISKPRNVALMKVFLDNGLVEQTGYGVPRIIDEYNEKVFEFFDNSIVVSLLFKTKSKDDAKEKSNTSLNETQKTIIQLLKENENITQSEIASRLNLSIQAIKKSFRDLSDKGFVERVGSFRAGKWVILVD